MPITYEGGAQDSTGTGNNTDTIDLVLPTHQADDLAIIFATAGGGLFVNLTANAEYTELIDSRVIDAQDETDYGGGGLEGTFFGGTGYSVNDTLTLSDGSTANVDAEVGNVVTEFTIDSSGSTPGTEHDDVLTEDSGLGNNDFTLTPEGANLTGFPQIAKAGNDSNIQCFYRKLTSSSDTNPTLTKASSTRAAAVLLLFRGVDTTTPFDVQGQSNATSNNALNSIPRSITPVTANGALVLIHHSPDASDYITTAGAPATPSGLSVGESHIPNAGFQYQDIVTAYKVDYGAAAEITMTKWLNEYFDGKINDAQTQASYDDTASEGTFTPGTGYTQDDTLTMTGGATVNADTVGGSGELLTFTVTQGADTGGHVEDDVLAATGGTGNDDFDLTLGFANIEGGFVEVGMGSLALRPAVAGGIGLSQLGTYGMNTLTGGFK